MSNTTKRNIIKFDSNAVKSTITNCQKDKPKKHRLEASDAEKSKDKLELNGKAVHSQVVEFLEKLGEGSVYKGLHRCKRELEYLTVKESSLEIWFKKCVDSGGDLTAKDCVTAEQMKNSYFGFCMDSGEEAAGVYELYSFLKSKGLTKQRCGMAPVKDRLGYRMCALRQQPQK